MKKLVYLFAALVSVQSFSAGSAAAVEIKSRSFIVAQVKKDLKARAADTSDPDNAELVGAAPSATALVYDERKSSLYYLVEAEKRGVLVATYRVSASTGKLLSLSIALPDEPLERAVFAPNEILAQIDGQKVTVDGRSVVLDASTATVGEILLNPARSNLATSGFAPYYVILQGGRQVAYVRTDGTLHPSNP